MTFVKLKLKTALSKGYPEHYAYIRPEMITTIHEEPSSNGETTVSIINGHAFKIDGKAEDIINEINSFEPYEEPEPYELND